MHRLHATKALARFVSSLSGRSQSVLLDLGPVVGPNLSFFGEELGCKIIVEDLYKDVEHHVGELARAVSRVSDETVFAGRRRASTASSAGICSTTSTSRRRNLLRISSFGCFGRTVCSWRFSGRWSRGRETGPNTSATWSWTGQTCSTVRTPPHVRSSGPCPTATFSVFSSRCASTSSSCSRPTSAKSFSGNPPSTPALKLWHHRPDAQFRSDRGTAPARAVRP